MDEVRTTSSKYHVEIRDARGVVIGDNNVVYQYFLDERYRPLAEHLIAFDDLLAERTTDFVGRAFLDARLAAFMAQHDRGYFVLVGEPGIGKTAWAAHVVREYQALHHFNNSAMGIVRPDQCMENLCAQIIARFQLDQPYLPVNAGRDGSLLDKLLRQAAGNLDGRKLVIAIDALDEAQMPADMRGANALYLPTSLPAGVYFVLTRRPQPMPLDTAPGTPAETFTLGAELPDNQTDVRAYLRQQAARPEYVARLTEQRVSTERFVEELAECSAGNFMYLAYLLPDIAVGLFDPLNLNGLPEGLRGYYERFWNELEAAKGEGREAWTKFYKPVIGMLAAAREPVSAAWIGRILGIDPDEVADFALARWRKFLHRADVAGEAHWRLYHASFADFLAEKLDGAKCYHDMIADHYCAACGDNWSKLADMDRAYGLRHLVAHLVGAARWDEAYAILSDYLFIRAKVEARILNPLLADYDLARAASPADSDLHVLELIQGALRLSAHVLAWDTAHLPSQLTGRLLTRREGEIQTLLAKIRMETKVPWLRPINASLTMPGGPLTRILQGHSYHGIEVKAALYPSGTATAQSAKRCWSTASR